MNVKSTVTIEFESVGLTQVKYENSALTMPIAEAQELWRALGKELGLSMAREIKESGSARMLDCVKQSMGILYNQQSATVAANR